MVKKIQKQRHTGIVGGELLEKLETFHWISGWGRIPPSRLSQSQLIPTSDQVGTPQPPVHGRDVRWVSCCTNVNWSVRCGRSILVLSYKYSSCSSRLAFSKLPSTHLHTSTASTLLWATTFDHNYPLSTYPTHYLLYSTTHHHHTPQQQHKMPSVGSSSQFPPCPGPPPKGPLPPLPK